MSHCGRVVLLAGEGASTRIVYHALARELGPVHTVIESRQPRGELLRRRLARLGALTVAGQVAFMVLAEPILRRLAARRIDTIKREFRLDDSPIDGPIVRVRSVNSGTARDAIRELRPAVVVVNGTRVIGPETLAAVADTPMVNLHAGLTPLYRGVHGGYWALAEGRPDLVGSTVHFVDCGVDTGRVIAQATFAVTAEDSFATYPYLHVAAGVPILLAAVRGVLAGSLTPRIDGSGLGSKLRSHPTLWGYVATRLSRGVR